MYGTIEVHPRTCRKEELRSRCRRNGSNAERYASWGPGSFFDSCGKVQGLEKVFGINGRAVDGGGGDGIGAPRRAENRWCGKEMFPFSPSCVPVARQASIFLPRLAPAVAVWMGIFPGVRPNED